MFLVAIISFSIVLCTGNINYIYPALVTIWTQFFIAIFFGIKYAPYSILGRFMVRKQQPDYTRAASKRFSWTLGFLMATTMFILITFFGVTGMIPFIFCTICLTLMWLESSCGICVGCKIYDFFSDKKRE